jgi:ribosomal protein S6--L-glutamate ligase
MEEGNPTVYYQGELVENVDAVIPRIGASVTFYGTAVLRQFEMQSVFTVNKSQAVNRSRNKLRSYQILSRRGVGIPKTVFANRSRGVDPLIKSVGGPPLIIKLLSGTQGTGVVLAETRKAAKSVIEAFYGLKEQILLQEFIDEAKSADVRAFVIDGEVVGAFKRQGSEDEFRSNLHRGGSIQKVKLDENEKEAARKASKALGLSVAGVDMLQSTRGPLILEVNSSPGLKGIEKGTGLDIADKIIEFVENSAHKEDNKRDVVGV